MPDFLLTLSSLKWSSLLVLEAWGNYKQATTFEAIFLVVPKISQEEKKNSEILFLAIL